MFKKILTLLLASLFITLVPVSANAMDLGAAPVDMNALLMAQAQAAQEAQAAAQQAQLNQILAAQEAAKQAQQEQLNQLAQAALAIEAAQKAQQEQLAQMAKAAEQAQITAALNAAQATAPVIPSAQPESAFHAASMALSLPDFVYIDISDQMAYMYRNGVLVTQGSCVTGNERAGYHTTRGIHQIVFMDRNRTLHGSYGEAFVKYWMRFTAGGQGLHDAGWRRKFGGDIYKTGGSHGCVNLERPVAETMYSYAYVGLPVIVVE
ncbi:MAG: L,D-transpeptidase [Lachnospiraceae bacterium]|nr:L,D-transpeptidase [Lachnospiraceae bacterium]